MTRTWILPAALLLTLANCHGPSPTQPLADRVDVDMDVDVWDGTRWGGLFREATKLGGRVELAGAVDGRPFRVLATEPRLWSVYSTPTCSVAGDPGSGEVRSYLECLDEKVRGSAESHRGPVWRLDETWPLHHLLTWDEDADMWNVWTVFWSRCGNAYWDMTEAGLIRPM